MKLEQLNEIRHYLHQNPELSDFEFKTTKFLENKLVELGYQIVTPKGLTTGVIAELGPANANKTIGLRADIDALPIQETTKLKYRSVNDNQMHACGHDLHMISLLGAVILFSENQDQLTSKVRLIFQPSEENHVGAQRVIDNGGINDLKAIIGYHNQPLLKVGELGMIAGNQMASVNQFKVTLTGIGTHAGLPHTGTDVIVGATNIINSLQTIISRNIDPAKTAVLSITHIEGGFTWNVLPDQTFFEGTTRSFSDEVDQKMKERFYEVIENLSQADGLKAEIEWIDGPKIVKNNPELTHYLLDEAKNYADVISIDPSTGGEDFSFYTDQIPSVFAFIGSDGHAGLHHSDLSIDDKAIKTAIDYYYHSFMRLQKELS